MNKKLILILSAGAAALILCAFGFYIAYMSSTTAYYRINIDEHSEPPAASTPTIIVNPTTEPVPASKDADHKDNIQQVIIKEITPPQSAPQKAVKVSKKTVYLTIDDGPSIETTNRMLDILKQYGVKATFFVMGIQVPGKEEILKRINEDGHAIGLHSYTHDIKKIYSSQDTFIDEMLKTSDVINRVIGVKPKIIRFPGGSSQRLNKELLDKLHTQNFKIYDWNISAGDGMYPRNPPERVLENAINPEQLTSNAILLMHTKPNNQTSCEALPLIIDKYRSMGYEFKVITDETPEYYFKFK